MDSAQMPGYMTRGLGSAVRPHGRCQVGQDRRFQMAAPRSLAVDLVPRPRRYNIYKIITIHMCSFAIVRVQSDHRERLNVRLTRKERTHGRIEENVHAEGTRERDRRRSEGVALVPSQESHAPGRGQEHVLDHPGERRDRCAQGVREERRNVVTSNVRTNGDTLIQVSPFLCLVSCLFRERTTHNVRCRVRKHSRAFSNRATPCTTHNVVSRIEKYFFERSEKTALFSAT